MATVGTVRNSTLRADIPRLPASVEPPHLPKWVSSPETKQDLNWASLATIDLSLLDSQDPQVRKELVAMTKKALSTDGFLYVIGTGVPQETLERQLAIAQHVISGIPQSEKGPYAAKLDEGSYKGYKLRGVWKRDDIPDNIEHYNLESSSFQSPTKQHHPSVLPFLPEIQAFADYTNNHIVRRLFTLVSLVLELEEDALWKLHSQEKPIGASCQRFMGYFPRDEDAESKTDGIWSKGHTDYNTLSLLWSQPISALQVLTPGENKWKWVKHTPGALVVNVADALDFLSGGVLKATRHRVIRPPSDQADIIRYILIHFARAAPDTMLNPIAESPLAQREGKNAFQSRIDQGGRAPTQEEWLKERIRRTGKELYDDERNPPGSGLVEEEILGTKVEYYV
ncbi:Iron/ascorbate family oxidoreductases [Phaffia rhodozyma]|uniref:Iron/ascorbate family oxidoreductases n=1 Tax=Phaffia rhodozyma TaxID=264483 RepID=A0A0F7SKJ9_PHARH|nr:Iron/ascorbate family oxidoreductases [Phaffia rhodozyma]